MCTFISNISTAHLATRFFHHEFSFNAGYFLFDGAFKSGLRIQNAAIRDTVDGSRHSL
jgi:hypothetical protein